jgi:hypothetical protein
MHEQVRELARLPLSLVFREGIRLFEIVFTGQSISLVHAASDLRWWHFCLPAIQDRLTFPQ